jgi:predicted DNA-binding transcriptional regulator AlpA
MRLQRYATDREVGRLLGVHRTTLWRWRRDRKGPPWVCIEGVVRYPLADLHTWLEDRLTKAG